MLFLHAFLLVSAAYITWTRRPSTKRAGESQLLPYCMPTSMHNFNNRPCHWNKSQSFSVSGPSYAHSNSISPEQKIGAQGINLWSIPNIFPTIWRPGGSGGARGGTLYFNGGGQTICLRCIALQPKEWQNWPQSRATKTSLIALLNFTVTRPGVMRWLQLPSCLHGGSSVRFSVFKDTDVKQLSPSHYEYWMFLLPSEIAFVDDGDQLFFSSHPCTWGGSNDGSLDAPVMF